jgi:hypothetical protein
MFTVGSENLFYLTYGMPQSRTYRRAECRRAEHPEELRTEWFEIKNLEQSVEKYFWTILKLVIQVLSPIRISNADAVLNLPYVSFFLF